MTDSEIPPPFPDHVPVVGPSDHPGAGVMPPPFPEPAAAVPPPFPDAVPPPFPEQPAAVPEPVAAVPATPDVIPDIPDSEPGLVAPSAPAVAEQVSGASAEDLELLQASEKWLSLAIDALNRNGRHKVADELKSQLGRQPKAIPTVIVAGEDKRGKSSLVNALLEYPNLSPTGVEVVTAAPIVLHRAASEEASFLRYGETQSIPSNFEEARLLATVTGNPMNEQNIRMVEIGINRPLLDRFEIVDTPGVGGLDSGHAELTLQSLRDADAMLFILEAGAQIRAQELKFLQIAASRISQVVFALTKVDIHRGWQTVLDTNRQILADRAPRLASSPMIPVSSQLALRATTLEGPDAVELRRESGVGELERILVESVGGRTAKLRVANLVQSGLTQLAQSDRLLSERVAAADSPQQAQEDLANERERLTELREDRAGWVQQFNGGVQRIGIDRREQVTRGIIEIRSKYAERLKTIKKSEHDPLPGEFVADLTAMASKINEWTESLLVQLVVTIVDDVDHNATVSESIRQVSDAAFLEELARLPLGKHNQTGTQKLQLLQAYSSGHGLAALVATGGVGLSIIAAPIAIAAGVGLGGLMAYNAFHNQRQTAFVSEFSSWMNEEISRCQVAISSGYERAMIDIQDKMRTAMTAAFNEREGEINDAIGACQRTLKQANDERQRDQKRLNDRLEDIRSVKRGGLQLLGRANS